MVGTAMLDRIARHEQSVESLQATVNILLEEREQSRHQMDEMRQLIQNISLRLSENGVDITTEDKMAAWKHNVNQHLSAISDQVQETAQQRHAANGSALAISALTDELRSTKAACVIREVRLRYPPFNFCHLGSSANLILS
eukprot:m.313485 g.313485  ORF g.313485 m.313485 type:complete len:141 (+) comp16408_c1_seq10:428-850(+)